MKCLSDVRKVNVVGVKLVIGRNKIRETMRSKDYVGLVGYYYKFDFIIEGGERYCWILILFYLFKDIISILD